MGIEELVKWIQNKYKAWDRLYESQFQYPCYEDDYFLVTFSVVLSCTANELNLLVQYPVTAATVNKLVPTMKDANKQVLDTIAPSQEKRNKGTQGQFTFQEWLQSRLEKFSQWCKADWVTFMRATINTRSNYSWHSSVHQPFISCAFPMLSCATIHWCPRHLC